MASDSHKTSSNNSNIWPWALAVGLLAGFIIGSYMGPTRGRGDADDAPRVAAVAPAAAPSGAGAAKFYKSEAEFPAGWMKSADFVGVAGTSWDGFSDAQKTTVMHAINERNCECGCGKGSVAHCAKTDTSCPRSPKMVKDILQMVKDGKTSADVFAYLDKENPPKGGGAAGAAAPAAPAGPKKVTIPAHAPRQGPKDAKVTIVAFSDFQCPFCSRVVPTLKEIHEKYPKEVAVVFVNQPLSFHDKARGAAKAFLAAHKQGKGWEMHDKMFANQQNLLPAELEKYAQELGLNLPKFKKDVDDPATEKMVAEDQALASSVGADGTPTFFINGRELSGAQPFPAFKTIIDEEIKKADDLIKAGTKPSEVYDKLMNAAAAAPPPAPAAAPAPGAKVKIEVGGAPSKGPKNAPVTVVAFSDFQCPFCSRAVPLMKQIEENYKGKVRIAFKHLPLSFHDKAQVAAEASMAANEQGKFWEYHDKLFANQTALDRPSLEKYAQELGLNTAKFKAALDSGKYKKFVEDDAKLAGTVGASGTPTFFVNGTSIVGAVPFEQFKTTIDAELAAKK